MSEAELFTSSERSGERSRPAGASTVRLAVAAKTAAYGLVVAVANARNDVVTNQFTQRRDWLLFGGGTDFPGDFGRNVFAGTVGLGVLFVALAAVVAFWGGAPRVARPVGIVTAAFSLLLVVTYRDSGNLLGARPSAAAVLLAVALYLLASGFLARARTYPHDADRSHLNPVGAEASRE